MKSELFNSILQAVSEECEINVDDILSQKRNFEILQARTMVVWFCFNYGLAPNDIAKYLGRRRAATVYAYRANYYLYKKMSTSFRISVHEVSNILSKDIPTTIS